MAKYTGNDPDIKYLDKYDRVNYNFDLLKFDVDKTQEMAEGAKSIKILTDPKQLGSMFKSPAKFAVAIYVFAFFFTAIMLFIFIVVMLILYIWDTSENKMRLDILKPIFIYFLAALIVLVILYIFINKISSETTVTGFMAK